MPVEGSDGPHLHLVDWPHRHVIMLHNERLRLTNQLVRVLSRVKVACWLLRLLIVLLWLSIHTGQRVFRQVRSLRIKHKVVKVFDRFFQIGQIGFMSGPYVLVDITAALELLLAQFTLPLVLLNFY